MPPGNTTSRRKPGDTVSSLVCPACAKVLEGEPNFCPACGGDLRGIGGMSDTLSGPLRDKLIDGRYKLLEKLGEGGMGSVFKVEHIRMGKMAALKLMRPDTAVDKGLKARFLQESRTVAKLSHPNTVQVFDSGELEDGSLYMAMEYVPGKDLAWHLKAHGPLTEEKAVSVAIQVLASLQEAHEYGIVHRDIKPANMMLVRRRRSGDDQVKLLDFGIAKLQEAEGRKSTTGDFIGTPAYMSPEQIRGENIDARSDLYSLGAVLFELVTGRQLYEGTPISIITAHTDSPIPRLAERAPDKPISPAFESVLRKALSKKQEDRFRDAEEMRVALEQLRRDLGALPAEYTPMPAELADKMLSREDFDKFERSLRLQRVVAPVVALVLVAGGAFGAWHYLKSAPVEQLATRELEPNDQAAQATRIPLAQDVRGTIGAAAAGENDRDLFVATVPEGPVRLVLTGVPDLNLTVEVLQLEKTPEGDKLKRRLFLDDVGPGGDERVDALGVTAGPLYVRVEEKPFCTEPNRPSREKSLVPYTLRVEALPPGGLESEPDDTPATAHRLPLTRALTAFAGARVEELEKNGTSRPDAPFSSPDWFRVDDVTEKDTVAVVVVPPERGALSVVDGADEEAARERRRPLPPGALVKGGPLLLVLKPMEGGVRRFRVAAAEDTLPGASYRLAIATGGDNGLAGLLDLAQALADANQAAARRQALEQATRAFERSPEAPRLRTLLASP